MSCSMWIILNPVCSTFPNIKPASLLSLEDELPFFANDASTVPNSWGGIQYDINWFLDRTASKKKIFFSQTGWPSNDSVWKANSPNTQASLDYEKQYFALLDSKCSYFKTLPVGGLGWFAHVWNDDGVPGWGIVEGQNGNLKFPFSAQTSC